MGKNGFKDLVVWRTAKDLAVQLYKLSDEGKIGKDLGLTAQIRRSAVSVASNLAEGDERMTNKEAARFFYVAKGSLAEPRTQLQIACEAGLLDKSLFSSIDLNCEKLGSMIGKLIRARSRTANP